MPSMHSCPHACPRHYKASNYKHRRSHATTACMRAHMQREAEPRHTRVQSHDSCACQPNITKHLPCHPRHCGMFVLQYMNTSSPPSSSSSSLSAYRKTRYDKDESITGRDHSYIACHEKHLSFWAARYTNCFGHNACTVCGSQRTPTRPSLPLGKNKNI